VSADSWDGNAKSSSTQRTKGQRGPRKANTTVHTRPQPHQHSHPCHVCKEKVRARAPTVAPTATLATAPDPYTQPHPQSHPQPTSPRHQTRTPSHTPSPGVPWLSPGAPTGQPQGSQTRDPACRPAAPGPSSCGTRWWQTAGAPAPPQCRCACAGPADPPAPGQSPAAPLYGKSTGRE
jgi:hypothetical protein